MGYVSLQEGNMLFRVFSFKNSWETKVIPARTTFFFLINKK